MKNHLFYSALLVWVVLLVLLGMHWLPSVSVGGAPLRRVDLLGDVRMPEPDTLECDSDTLPLPPVAKPAFVDTCCTGMTCIDDFSDSTCRGMSRFYEALDRMDEGRPVRVAVFGDSFIEADILTADLRKLLQERYGGQGVGYVDITSITYGFRPTVRQSFDCWDSHASTDSTGFRSEWQGISGRYFFARPGAWVELRGTSKYAPQLDTCGRATLYYCNRDPQATVNVRLNGGTGRDYVLPVGDGLQKMEWEGRIGSLRCTVEQADSTLFYGIALDGHGGIAVDNFSVRGSSGLSLAGIPARTLRGFEALRPYDLLILQYGLNVATPKGKAYDRYRQGMARTITHLKECFPQASILLLSVGDRDYKTEEGDLRTMPGIKNLVRYQQAIAADNAIAFWNLYEAMGGEGSMAGLAARKPPLANYDYTHINHRGGAYIAQLLYETLVYGKQQFDRRREYEGGE